jgi:hypothetical protein
VDVSVYTSSDDELCCPLCGDINTHVDRAMVAGRPQGEDGPITEIAFRADGIVADATGEIPESHHVGVGRRHRIALIGWCESCSGEFALLFTQHKGVTLVESVDLGDRLPAAFDVPEAS